jgi:hypothetical protein
MAEVAMGTDFTAFHLKSTVETLIELDEPEALLSTLRKAVARQRGKRWEALSRVLDEADWKLDMILNAKPAGPDFRPDAPGAKGNSQPQPTGADNADPIPAATPAASAAPAVAAATQASGPAHEAT